VNRSSSIPDPVEEQERQEEERRLRRLRRLVDFSLALILQADLALEEAQNLHRMARNTASRLFPGKESTFDLIYTPRFRRVIAEKYALQ